MKPATSVFTVRLPVEIQKKLDLVAESMDRSRSWIVEQVIMDFIQAQEAFKAAVQEGINAADRGEFATGDKMEALFSRYDPPKRKRRKRK